MVAEVLNALKPKPGGHYADGTLGGAGHSAAILTASSPTGWLFGCDHDGAAVEAAKQRLEQRFSGRFEIALAPRVRAKEIIRAPRRHLGVYLGSGRRFIALVVTDSGCSSSAGGSVWIRHFIGCFMMV